MRGVFLIGGLVLAVLVIVLIQYGPDWFVEPDPAAEPEVVVAPIEVPKVADPVVVAPKFEVVAEEEEPVAAEIEVPALDDSDSFVLEQIASFDLPKVWVERQDLMRRLAVVVDNASRGEYPRRQLGFLAPPGAFKVARRGEDFFVDPVSYARFDVYLDIVEKMDVEMLAAVLLLFEPLLSDGLAELGNRKPVYAQIDAAIEQMLSVPVLTGDVQLLRPEVFYEYADPRLEALSPLQKQVLRTGPRNVTRLQRYLLGLQAALVRGNSE